MVVGPRGTRARARICASARPRQIVVPSRVGAASARPSCCWPRSCRRSAATAWRCAPAWCSKPSRAVSTSILSSPPYRARWRVRSGRGRQRGRSWGCSRSRTPQSARAHAIRALAGPAFARAPGAHLAAAGARGWCRPRALAAEALAARAGRAAGAAAAGGVRPARLSGAPGVDRSPAKLGGALRVIVDLDDDDEAFARRGRPGRGGGRDPRGSRGPGLAGADVVCVAAAH